MSADDLSRPVGQMVKWEIISLVMLASSSRSLRHGSVADMNYKSGQQGDCGSARTYLAPLTYNHRPLKTYESLMPFNALSEILYYSLKALHGPGLAIESPEPTRNAVTR